IKPQTILQFHRDMYKYLPQPGGRWKATDNVIEEKFPDGVKRVRFEPVKPFLVPEAMDQLCNNFNRFRDNQEYDDLLLINAFILDFLCIHPFADGNGRMARLLTLLLLYQAGFEVGRFISIERIIEQSKETYYDVLFKSSQGWHHEEHDPIPWMDYSLGVILAAYKELKERINLTENQRGTKSALVKDAIEHFVGEFTLQDIKKACPTVSRSTIYRVLEELRNKGKVDCVVSGRHARWLKNE
ncbi:MAG: Fic family protein, partial [Desulfitobacterium hafniense]|nr:Fic family protein [Desulfitobacterium hafniense]